MKFSAEGRTVYIHSKYDPVREAQQQAAELTLGVQTTYFVFGLGLGYLPKALLARMGEDNHLVVFEPNQFAYNHFVNDAENREFLEDPRVLVALYDTPQKIAIILNTFYDSTTAYKRNFVHFMPVYKELYVKQCRDFAVAIKNQIYDCALAMNTNTIFSDIWFRCQIDNSQFLRRSYAGLRTAEQCQGRPAIVVSAGPTLAKNIDLLHELKGKALILCVDTAYKPLTQHGIQPDFVVTIDAQPKVMRKFADTDIFDQDLITSYMCATDVLKAHRGRIAAVSEKHVYLDRCYDELGIELLNAHSGGSVACTALSVAKELGADPIVMVGQDLAYTNEQSHIAGTAFYHEGVAAVSQGMLEVESVDGGTVYTTHNLNSYRNWIESFAAVNEDVEVIDATEGGALIRGTRCLTLQEVLDTYCQEPLDVAGLKESVFAPESRTATKEQYLGFLEDMVASARYLRRTLPEVKECTGAIDRIIKEVELHGFQRPDRIANPYKRVKKLNKALDKNEGYVDIILPLVSKERDAASVVDSMIHKSMSEEEILVDNLQQYVGYFRALYEKGNYAVPLIEAAVAEEKNKMEEWGYE